MPQRYSTDGSSGCDAIGELTEPAELLGEPDERMHDLDERRLSGALLDGGCCADDRPHLHLVDLGELQSEPAAAGPEHRVGLVELLDPSAHQIGARLLG